MLPDEIKQFFKGEVETDNATLEKYSTDASIFKVRPQVVVFPRDREDIKNLVKFARKKREAGERVSLTARAAGTDMSGGPLTESIVVDFTRHLNQLKEIGTDYAVVEPGMYYRDFEKAVGEKGLLLPSYPASKQLCAIGGIVANNSGGEKTLMYGKTERYVKELKVILDDGEEYTIKSLTKAELEEKIELSGSEGRIYRELYKLIEENYAEIMAAKPNVSKNSAGYYLWNVWNMTTFDLPKLIVGSQGTLCIVTEVMFHLVPDMERKEKHSHLVVLFLEDSNALGALVKKILEFKPESLELYDDKTFKLALKFFPGFLKTLGAKNLFVLAIRFLPEFFLLLRGGIPKLVLLADFHGAQEADLHERFEKLQRELAPFKIRIRGISSKKDAEKYWTIRRESFSLLRKKVKDRRTAPFVDDVVVRSEFLQEFLPKLNALLEPHKRAMTYTIAGHAGDGNVHIIPLMDLKNPASRDLIFKIAEKVYDLVVEYKGSTTAEHNDGLMRSPYLEKMYGKEICALFRKTKEIFDPLNIFNPGKKVGTTLEYAKAHVNKEY